MIRRIPGATTTTPPDIPAAAIIITAPRGGAVITAITAPTVRADRFPPARRAADLDRMDMGDRDGVLSAED